MIESLLGLGAAGILHAALDSTAWRAYDSVEQAWIQRPSCVVSEIHAGPPRGEQISTWI